MLSIERGVARRLDAATNGAFDRGDPVFLCIEAMTTATQLILHMAQASAMLAGDNNPVTAWDGWSRFLEAGGQFIVVCSGGVLVGTSTGKGNRCEVLLSYRSSL